MALDTGGDCELAFEFEFKAGGRGAGARGHVARPRARAPLGAIRSTGRSAGSRVASFGSASGTARIRRFAPVRCAPLLAQSYARVASGALWAPRGSPVRARIRNESQVLAIVRAPIGKSRRAFATNRK